MKVRIKFAKYGTMKFIGHLDLMRFFQKAMRRSGIDISFTEGMSPHMIMSFAAPLGLGTEGMAEYADIQIGSPVSTAEALARLNRVSVEGIEFLDFLQIREGKAGKAMSLVTAADYAVEMPPVRGSWQEFLAQSEILSEKETKKGLKKVDIKPLIYEISPQIPMEASAQAAQRALQIWEEQPRVRGAAGSDRSDLGGDRSIVESDREASDRDREEQPKQVVYMRLAAGSAANLKPELVLKEMAAFSGNAYDPFAYRVTRLELYTDTGTEGLKKDDSLCAGPLFERKTPGADGESIQYFSLSQLGKPIE